MSIVIALALAATQATPPAAAPVDHSQHAQHQQHAQHVEMQKHHEQCRTMMEKMHKSMHDGHGAKTGANAGEHKDHASQQ